MRRIFPAAWPVTAFRRAGTVVFDCDSTLSTIEGIEELSHAHRARIERLTNAAMDGTLPLESVYGERLALVRPGRRAIEALGERYVETLVPDARETVAALRAERIDVRIVSGGLLPAVRTLAAALGIPDNHVAAVNIRFDDRGEFAGYDAASPLARSGGKTELLHQWRERAARPMMLVGDGATDLEAKPAVDFLIAFAGVAERQAVTAAADAVIRVLSLAPVVPLALAGEPPLSVAARAVYEKGVALLESATRAALRSQRNPRR
ncbi:MAG: HAD-IB family phosphatase [Longimicrobiales bacterium]